MSTVTLKEIAAAARTDTGTVSRVLSGGYRKARISEQRAREIRSVAERLRWRPNVAARSTRTGRFDSIAIVSSTVLEFGHYLSPWFLNWVHDEAHRRNHMVNYVRLSPQQVEGAERAKLLEEVAVDGWLLNFNTTLPDSLARQIEQLRIPAILINNQAPLDAVRPADVESARELTEAMIRGGRRRIVYYDNENRQEIVHRPETHYSVGHRQRGYELAMREAGLEPRVVRPAERIRRADAMAYAATQLDVISAADGMITYNPFEAQALLATAERSGRRVPEDLLLGSFHDSAIGDGGLPIMTAVLPWRDLACTAVDMLMQKIEDPAKPLPSRALPCEIHIPASVSTSLAPFRGGETS